MPPAVPSPPLLAEAPGFPRSASSQHALPHLAPGFTDLSEPSSASTPAPCWGTLSTGGPLPWPRSGCWPLSPLCPSQNYELILHEGTYKVVQWGPGEDLPYRVRYMGTHLAIETRSGLVVSWDRKTSVFIRLHQEYKVSAGGRAAGPSGRDRAPSPPWPAGPLAAVVC